MKISKQGITFNYNNDEITWLWWWKRTNSNCPYFSLVYNYWFLNFRQYWLKVGGSERNLPTSKIQGYSMENLISSWIKFNCRTGCYVLLYDINVESKPASFWRTIPDRDKTQLLADVVLLRCKDWDEIQRLCDSITTNFATAAGIKDGHIVYWNE